jgi:hypothetical protein
MLPIPWLIVALHHSRPIGRNEPGNVDCAGLNAPTMLLWVRTDHLNLDHTGARSHAEVAPCVAGNHPLINGIRDDDMAQAQIVPCYSKRYAIPDVVNRPWQTRGVSNRLLNRVNSQPDGVELPSQLPSDRRLARSWKPREYDEHRPHLHRSRDARRRLARTPLNCGVKPVGAKCRGRGVGGRQTSSFVDVVSTLFPPYRSHACMTSAPSGGRP